LELIDYLYLNILICILFNSSKGLDQEAIEKAFSSYSFSAYRMSKVGLSALTRIQQRHFDQDPRPDLIVNSVHPGYVDTDMTKHLGGVPIEQGFF